MPSSGKLIRITITASGDNSNQQLATSNSPLIFPDKPFDIIRNPCAQVIGEIHQPVIFAGMMDHFVLKSIPFEGIAV